MPTASSPWFKDWFNTPYYHALYAHRSHDEAAAFIQQLIDTLQPPVQATMLDVACGKGRHARQLAQNGFDVTGIDLSEASIEAAQADAHDYLHFYQHDMRRVFRINYFDYVFNFFTSFGYFDHPRDNQRALRAMATAMKPTGTLVMDFLHVDHAIRQLVPSEQQQRGNVTFNITREATPTHIIKTIRVTDPELAQPLVFQEQVARLTLADFDVLFAQVGLKRVQLWGNYQLADFDPADSPRLIMMAKRL